MNLYEKILYSIILGVIITLASSLFPSLGGGIGVQAMGFPFGWLTQVVYPGAPMQIDWIGLILDIVIWSVIGLVIIQLFLHFERE
jgi:hypothetical protein